MQRYSEKIRNGFARAGKAINLGPVVQTIWRQKGVFLAFPAVLLILGISYLHFADYKYTVTMQLSPVQQSQADMGQLSQIASMAGVNLQANNQVDPFQLYLQGLFTREAADELAKDQGLMRVIFPKEWDDENHRWHEHGGIGRAILNALRFLLGAPMHLWRPPDSARLQEFISDNLHVTQDIKSPVVTIDMDYPDPQGAVYFMTRLNNAVDEGIKKQALARATIYIDYLNKQLQVVTIAGLQQALIQLVTDQEKQKMAASSSLSYSAEVFQKPAASQWTTSPNPFVVVGLAVFIGILLGGFAAFYWDGLSKRESRRMPAGQYAAGD
jgi:hypothetical protein